MWTYMNVYKYEKLWRNVKLSGLKAYMRDGGSVNSEIKLQENINNQIETLRVNN